MTKAVKKIIEFGKKNYKLHRIDIRMDTRNRNSRAIPKKLGFKYEGILRDVQLHGRKFFDHEVWALIVK